MEVEESRRKQFIIGGSRVKKKRQFMFDIFGTYQNKSIAKQTNRESLKIWSIVAVI